MAKTTVDQQFEYLAACGAGTSFVPNRKRSPKKEFFRLAKSHRDWTPTDAIWCTSWRACFGEEFEERNPHAADVAANNSITARESSTSPAPSSASSDTSSASSSSSGPISSGRGSPIPRARARRKKHKRVEEHFDKVYGTNYSKLEAWQQLCADVGIEEVLPSIKKCKKALEKVYINIYDFIDGCPRRFSSVSKLRDYSIATDKVYPLGLAKRDTFHRTLLHVLFFRRKK